MTDETTGEALLGQLTAQASGQTDAEFGRAVREAKAARDQAKLQVHAWLDLEGQAGHLVTAAQAPGWHAYEQAEDALTELLKPRAP